MDGKTHMTCEVDELSVEHTFGRSPDDDTFKVIVPILSGCTLDLLIGFNMAVQEEFHRRAGIKSDKEVSGLGENENKAIDGTEGEFCLHPIYLGTFSRQKLKLVIYGRVPFT
ncbi:MAG: hypothetical protein ABFD82_01685 [Syntrophaceae bacterium]